MSETNKTIPVRGQGGMWNEEWRTGNSGTREQWNEGQGTGEQWKERQRTGRCNWERGTVKRGNDGTEKK